MTDTPKQDEIEALLDALREEASHVRSPHEGGQLLPMAARREALLVIERDLRSAVAALRERLAEAHVYHCECTIHPMQAYMAPERVDPRCAALRAGGTEP